MLRVRALLIAVMCLICTPLWAQGQKVKVDYQVRFVPETNQAQVSLSLNKAERIRSFDFNLTEEGRYSDFQGDGQWTQGEDGRGVWLPGEGKSTLTYWVKIDNERNDGRYDARMTEDWVLMRGDDLVPAAKVDLVDGTELSARLEFVLPKGWRSVETGWPRIGKNRFRLDNPERKFDRPTGWLLAGKLGTRRTRLGETDVAISAPVGEGLRRMDVMTFLTFIWPQMQAVFPRDPEKLLIVGAGDPMWRGGLSAANSYFMHSDRPVVSENGTSSLLHELVHVFGRIYGHDRSDWIAEGLAEYYAIELMRRAGGIDPDRYQKIREQLVEWSKPVKSLRTDNASGAVTARAVLLLQDLDREIRQKTKDSEELSLDDVSRGLMRMGKVSTQDFIEITENVIGGPSDTLDTRLLR